MQIKYLSHFVITVFGIFAVLFSTAQNRSISQKVDSVCKLMTLEEKIGVFLRRAFTQLAI